jgi:ABC-type polysaccharide/polyol phosphate transport system ATPase subunit
MHTKSLSHFFLKKRSKSRTFWALNDIHFSLNEGEVLGVLGSNGAGKSTLLKVLSGVITPDKGSVVSHRGSIPVLLTLGAGFQPNLTGRDNIYLNGLMLGMKQKQIDEMFDFIVDYSEIEPEFIDEPVRTYSSGMKARLGFSIAQAVDPDILLIDEVLGVGDQSFKEKSRKTILEKIKSNKTVVLVSHSASQIRQLCTRVLWLHDRKQRALGDVNPIVDEYMEFMRKQKREKAT